MLYLMSIDNKNNKNIYNIFETHTESLLAGNGDYIKRLALMYKMEPVNMTVTKDAIKVKTWPQPTPENLLNRQYKYILLAKATEQKFKMLRFDGKIIYFTAQELKNAIRIKFVCNCSYSDDEYKSMDTYNIKLDNKFQIYIDKKYEEFIAKTILLGMDIKFSYIIENEDIKIIDYNGTSRKIIIPNFITTICSGAFRNYSIDEIRLNDGLKHIGEKAFAYNDIDNIEIPKSVMFVGYQAFIRSVNATNVSKGNNQTIRKLNSKTILL